MPTIAGRAITTYLMKGCLRTILAVAFLSIPVYADNYTIQFKSTNAVPGYPSVPSSGSFTYDGTAFTNFLVEFDGIQFDLTAHANSPVVNTTADCSPGVSGPLASFGVLSLNVPGCPTVTFEWYVTDPTTFYFVSLDADGRNPVYFLGNTSSLAPIGFPGGSGAWTITDTSVSTVPELSSLPLLLTAFSAVGLIYGRKRLRQLVPAIESQKLEDA
jgi:hypothetical protein